MPKWLIAAFLLGACSYSTPADAAPVVPPVDLGTESQVVIETLDDIAQEMTSPSSVDLEMAWRDLDSDLRSVIADVRTRPGTVDLEGVNRRVQGFVDRFLDTPEVAATIDHWDRLLTNLDAMVRRIEAAIEMS